MSKKGKDELQAPPGDWGEDAISPGLVILGEDKDTVDLLPLTFPVAGRRIQGSNIRKVWRYAAFVLTKNANEILIREMGVKERADAFLKGGDAWGTQVLRLTRHGVKDSMDTRYHYVVVGGVPDDLTAALLTDLQAMAARLIETIKAKPVEKKEEEADVPF